MVNYEFIEELEERFECTRCGVCCTNDYLRIVTKSESMYLAGRALGDKLLESQVHFEPLIDIPGSYSLNHGESCPFYDYGLEECKVYDIRPECCRKFPIRSLSEGRSSLECSMSCVGFFTACADMLEVPAYCRVVK